eukprot:6252113-Alexandrium_andersonii.AAC.1
MAWLLRGACLCTCALPKCEDGRKRACGGCVQKQTTWLQACAHAHSCARAPFKQPPSCQTTT